MCGRVGRDCRCQSHVSRLIVHSFDFPMCVPSSTIIERSIYYAMSHDPAQVPAAINMAARALYLKYIDGDSRLQINVSYQSRYALDRYYNEHLAEDSSTTESVMTAAAETGPSDLKAWIHERSHMFDHCIDEMMKLTLFSVSRFMGTDEYTLWMQTIGMNSSLHHNLDVISEKR